MADVQDTARELYARADYRSSREAALEGLQDDPDNLELLRLAGRSGVEIGAEDAVELLQRAAELRPDDAESWRDLGDALAADGRLQEAEAAWRRLTELRPDDSRVLTALGHTALAAGLTDEAADHLLRAQAAEPRNRSASVSLVDVYRGAGRLDDALAVARNVWEAEPEDVLAGLDVAELSLAVGSFDAADAAYEKLLELDDEGHEAFVRFGQIEVALRREAWKRASELAAAAAQVDSTARTRELLIFFADRSFGSLDRSATSPEIDAALVASQSGVFALPAMDEGPPVVPQAADVERSLAEARAEHRRIHVEEGAFRG